MRSTRRGGRTHGPGALGGRAAVRGVPLACLCARLSATARREDRNGLACEASPAALSATHSVECVPAAARGVPPLAATPAPPFARLEGAPPPLTPMAARDKTDPKRELLEARGAALSAAPPLSPMRIFDFFAGGGCFSTAAAELAGVDELGQA